MAFKKVCLDMGEKHIVCEVEYNPAIGIPAVTHLSPADCCEAESQEIEIITLTLEESVCGIDINTRADWMISIFDEEIKEQICNGYN